jgi:hypothetical protein
MKQHAVVSVVRRETLNPAGERNVRLEWGLAGRLPRWRAFDGRRSQVAINWTGSMRGLVLMHSAAEDYPANARVRSGARR